MTILIIFGGLAALYMLSLAFRLAALALPTYAGIFLAVEMIGSGHGHGAAILSGLAAGSAVLLLGRLVAAVAPSTSARLFIVALFAVPAGFAGYRLAHGLAGLLLEAGPWLTVTSAAAALLVASSAATALGLPSGKTERPPAAESANEKPG